MFGQKHSVYYTNFYVWRTFVGVLILFVLLIYAQGQDFSQSRIRELRLIHEYPIFIWVMLMAAVWQIPSSVKEILFMRPVLTFDERGLCLERLSQDIIPWSNIRGFSVRKRRKTRAKVVEVMLHNKGQYRNGFWKSLSNKILFGRSIVFPLTGLDMKPEPLMAMLLTYSEMHKEKEVEEQPNAVFGKKSKYRSDLSRA